jgi:6-phosphogluconolactonase
MLIGGETMHKTRTLLVMAAALALAPPIEAASKNFLVYVGTYTGPQSKGIYAYRFDAETGKLDTVGLVAELNRPSFLTIHPNRKYMYAVSELRDSTVTAFGIDEKSGVLKLLNTVPTKGGSACHLVVDQTGKTLLVANYGSGSSAVTFRVGPDGRLSESTSQVQHTGSGPDSARQRGPHAHAVVLSPDNRFAFVPDLGLDKIFGYHLDPALAAITANDPPFVTVPPGSGPRHFAFHPKGKFAYSVNEMKSSVTAFAYDKKKGALTNLQTTANLPQDFTGVSNAAEIDIDPAGKYLYASNRGHDSITVYKIDAGKGTLTLVERVPTQGKTPRGFKIDPTGHYLIAGNQDSNSVVVFKRDPATGRLTPTGVTANVGSPVNIEFLPID